MDDYCTGAGYSNGFGHTGPCSTNCDCPVGRATKAFVDLSKAFEKASGIKDFSAENLSPLENLTKRLEALETKAEDALPLENAQLKERVYELENELVTLQSHHDITHRIIEDAQGLSPDDGKGLLYNMNSLKDQNAILKERNDELEKKNLSLTEQLKRQYDVTVSWHDRAITLLLENSDLENNVIDLQAALEDLLSYSRELADDAGEYRTASEIAQSLLLKQDNYGNLESDSTERESGSDLSGAKVTVSPEITRVVGGPGEMVSRCVELSDQLDTCYCDGGVDGPECDKCKKARAELTKIDSQIKQKKFDIKYASGSAAICEKLEQSEPTPRERLLRQLISDVILVLASFETYYRSSGGPMSDDFRFARQMLIDGMDVIGGSS